MDRRIAILGIIVENTDSVERVNELLHEYREFIVGRMGMPYRERGISVISVVMDADTGCQCQGSLFQGIIDQPVLPENLSYR